MSNPSSLISALLEVVNSKVIPLTEKGVSSGSKLFGAAILERNTLKPVMVATNNESVSPLLHGETNCIQEFFTKIPKEERPHPKDCIFLATHEPCSLCLSAITWSGFNEFYYLFTYEDSRDLFAIPYDIQILEQVFRVPAEGETEDQIKKRELYNRHNDFFTSSSFAELLNQIHDSEQKASLAKRIEDTKKIYNGLSDIYQNGKKKGVDSESVWA